jgi:hypothetical protein
MGGPARQIWTEVGEYKISYRGEHAENGERFIIFYEGYWRLSCEALGFVKIYKRLGELSVFICKKQTYVADSLKCWYIFNRDYSAQIHVGDRSNVKRILKKSLHVKQYSFLSNSGLSCLT